MLNTKALSQKTLSAKALSSKDQPEESTVPAEGDQSRRPIRVVLVEDHSVVRSALVSYLRDDKSIDVVGEAGDGGEALRVIRSVQPDVVLMDLRLPTLSGAAAVQAVKAGCPGARILVLSSYEGEEDIHNALNAGAIGYLFKRMSAEEITRALHSAYRNEPVIPEAVAGKLSDRRARAALTKQEGRSCATWHVGSATSRSVQSFRSPREL